MRLLLQAQRGFENEQLEAAPRSIRLKAREVLELATGGGASAIGLEASVGSITPGKQADLVLTRTDAINMVPATDPVGALVLNANAHDVDTVLVGGRAVKRGGKLIGVDWPTTADALAVSARRIHAGFEVAPVEQLEEAFAPFML